MSRFTLTAAVGLTWCFSASAFAGTISFFDPMPLTGDHPCSFCYTPYHFYRIDIMISGGEQITGAEIEVFLGDGGEELGGSDASPPFPSFADIQVVSPDNVFRPPDVEGGSVITNLTAYQTVQTLSGTRTATGRLASVLIDTSYLALGIALNLSLELPHIGLRTKIFTTDGVEVPQTLEHAVISEVPEPATGLMFLAWIGLLRRRPCPARHHALAHRIT